ncbi:group II intron reverse transcriptase/maturase [Metallumcola ferriviriculae]|uniref:Group II intron reverse transcriptase/maturase n=1 Tax=Metallumcola ferriviriculae TaxID=3039180 RepID=A0AAU0ULD2_9FIRM|nr:group II intron reverse transcriptase/maturase [Desulfitibacteraceae bacterium MK1]
MAQKFDYLKSETELREITDELYNTARVAFEEGNRPSVTGLVEIMSSETTIVTAIHNIKSNKGSKTPGVDYKTMQKDYLERPYKWVIKDIQDAFKRFTPQKIKRQFIDKPGKTEKRPLGIPSVRDRIVQECIRIVLEPILEAQFFKHSYGFRPMRDTKMALQRITDLVHKTGYYWVVEGDISKCFDKINHRKLLKRLYHMGIKDRRVLQIIKAMLKAGVLGENETSNEGSQQGSVLSPLLANVYMDMLDEWLSNQWENKRTRYKYSIQWGKMAALRERSNLIPEYLVRYADDFCVLTDSKEHAEWLKNRIQKFLHQNMKLNLSGEKTLITDLRRNYIKFLGFEYKVVKGNAKKGYITRTIPNRKSLKSKVDAIGKDINNIHIHASKEQVIHSINLINSKIRGLINYYSNCSWVNVAMKEFGHKIAMVAYRRLKQYKGKWISAKETQNLHNVHKNYNQKIPALKYGDIYIGVTSLTFCKWETIFQKNQNETPFTEEGRRKHFKRTKKKRQNARLENMLTEKTSMLIAQGLTGKNYNFEFYMNRAYALNRDKLKCRCCGKWLYSETVYTHRINPNLPINLVNKVSNLASMDKACFELVNDGKAGINHLEPKMRRKIESFRERLGNHK